VSFDWRGAEETGGVLEGGGGCCSGGINSVEIKGSGTTDNVHFDERML